MALPSHRPALSPALPVAQLRSASSAPTPTPPDGPGELLTRCHAAAQVRCKPRGFPPANTAHPPSLRGRQRAPLPQFLGRVMVATPAPGPLQAAGAYLTLQGRPQDSLCLTTPAPRQGCSQPCRPVGMSCSLCQALVPQRLPLPGIASLDGARGWHGPFIFGQKVLGEMGCENLPSASSCLKQGGGVCMGAQEFCPRTRAGGRAGLQGLAWRRVVSTSPQSHQPLTCLNQAACLGPCWQGQPLLLCRQRCPWEVVEGRAGPTHVQRWQERLTSLPCRDLVFCLSRRGKACTAPRDPGHCPLTCRPLPVCPAA